MEPRYTDLLHTKHPILFRGNYGYAGGRGMPECNNGWLEVVDKMCNALEAVLLMYNIPEAEWPYVRQIKEKFGLLRFYTSGFKSDLTAFGSELEMNTMYDMFYAIITKQENATCHICERCGSPDGQRHGGGWIHVLCDPCEQWYSAAKNDANLMEDGYYISIPYGDTQIAELAMHVEQVE